MKLKKEWSDIEVQTLLKLKRKKLSYLEIGEILQRSPDSLRTKFWSLQKEEKLEHEKARILIFDIESSLIEFQGFRTGTTYLNSDNIKQDYFILSYAAKWYGEEKVFSDVVTSREAKRRDDKRICRSLFKLLDEADIVIAHNAKFDTKKSNTRFLYNGLGIPRPYKVICTLKLIRKVCDMSSNKLDYALRYFGLGGKVEHYGLQMWKDCSEGKQEALDLMIKYNRGDVTELEKLYDLLKDGMSPLKNKYGWNTK